MLRLFSRRIVEYGARTVALWAIAACNPVSWSKGQLNLSGSAEVCWTAKQVTTTDGCMWQRPPMVRYHRNEPDQNFWLRLKLPVNNMQEPLLTMRVLSSVEVYQNHKLIYAHGNLAEPDKNLNNSQTIFVKLANHHDDIIARFSSPLDEIGIYNNAAHIGRFNDFLLPYLAASTPYLVEIAVYATLTLLVFLAFLADRGRKIYLLLAALVGLGLTLKGTHGLDRLLALLQMDHELYYHIRHFNYLCYAALFTSFCKAILTANALPSRLIKVISYTYAALAVGAVMLFFAGIVTSKAVWNFGYDITRTLNFVVITALASLLLTHRPPRRLKLLITALALVPFFDIINSLTYYAFVVDWNLGQGMVLVTVLFTVCWYTIRQEQQHKRKLEQTFLTYRAMSATVQMLAHDIVRPFRILQLLLSLLKEKERSKDLIQRCLERVESSMVEAQAILADVSQIGEQTSGLNWSEVDFNTLLYDSLTNFYLCSSAPVVRFRYQLSCAQQLRADSGKLYRVMQNLIENASLHTPAGGCLWFESRLVSDNGRKMAHLVVGNSGSVIRPDVLDKVFDQFFTSNPVAKSRGLGLAICHKLIADHGGRIWAISDQTLGTEFHFTLPIGQSLCTQRQLPTTSADIKLEA